MPVTPLAMHRTIVAIDVEGFGDRCQTNPHRVAVRVGLYRALRHAFRAATIPWVECHHEDRGDGVLILAPPEIAKSVFVESFPARLVEELREHTVVDPSTRVDADPAADGPARRRSPVRRSQCGGNVDQSDVPAAGHGPAQVRPGRITGSAGPCHLVLVL